MPAMELNGVSESVGAQPEATPVVGCAHAITGRPVGGAANCGTITDPEMAIGSFFSPRER